MTKEKPNNQPYLMKVIGIKMLAPDVRSLVLDFVKKTDAKKFTFSPGQFIIVSVHGYGESVLTITSTKKDLPRIEIAVRAVGNNTQAIHRLKEKDFCTIRGPFGNFFDFAKMAGKQVSIVAGGIGLAPLRSFIKTVEEDPKIIGPLKILVGAKTPLDLIFKNDLVAWQKFAGVKIAVDKADSDWTGHVGKVTDLIDQINIYQHDSHAILCGPPIMFEPTIKKLKKYHLPDENIYLMLERRMKCGIGKCQHCTCGDKYVCTDGPTFSWAQIKDNWEILK